MQTTLMTLIVTSAVATPPPLLKEVGSFIVNGEVIPKDGIVQFTYEPAWPIFHFGPNPDE
jgi:hypothetical protein